MNSSALTTPTANCYGGAIVPASPDSEGVVEIEWEHPPLTLVLAVHTFEAEGVG